MRELEFKTSKQIDEMSSRLKLKTTGQRSKLMSHVRQSGTSAELTARRILRSLGYSYTAKSKGLPGTPDLISQIEKWAIFVHGCFWHAHRNCALWKIPKNNRAFWRKKFESNIERDKRKLRELKDLGYDVLILWGCELRQETKARRKIVRFMRQVLDDRASRSGSNGKLGSRFETKPTYEERESYDFTQSRKYVTRTVRLNDDKVVRTRLLVNASCSRDVEPKLTFDHSFLRVSERQESRGKNLTIQVADLFCGCGGLSLGAREACHALNLGFESVLAIDQDFESLEIYRTNFVPKQYFEKDIRLLVDGKVGSPLTSNEKSLLEELSAIEILLAGPPCQGHSDLNNHTRRNDLRNGLYETIGRFAEIARPQYILAENVPNVIHSHDRSLENTIAHLSKCGYKVDTGIIDLSEIGVPQRRKRHVLIASRNRAFSVKDVIELNCVSQVRDVEWAIGDLEKGKANGMFTSPCKHNSENQKRIAYLFKHNLYDLPDHKRPLCHRNGHTYKSMYGRMKYDEPAQTITSGFGCPGQGRFIHPTLPRALTPHEAARLQFFPDFFNFTNVKTRSALANMIGNAVPMRLAYVFCLEFLIDKVASNRRSGR